jgi:hypothetical protein
MELLDTRVKTGTISGAEGIPLPILTKVIPRLVWWSPSRCIGGGFGPFA